MSSAENGRLCWLTEDEAKKGGVVTWDRWEAAPADPAEAVTLAIDSWHHDNGVGSQESAVLAALGVPQRPTPRDETP